MQYTWKSIVNYQTFIDNGSIKVTLIKNSTFSSIYWVQMSQYVFDVKETLWGYEITGSHNHENPIEGLATLSTVTSQPLSEVRMGFNNSVHNIMNYAKRTHKIHK
jgi:hypothetical protein